MSTVAETLGAHVTEVVTTYGDQTIYANYDSNWNLTGAQISTVDPNGDTQTAHYDANWQLVSASQVDLDSNGDTTTINYGPNWVMTSATERLVTGGDISDYTTENFDANWHLTSATQSTGVFIGQIYTQTVVSYDDNWNDTGATVYISGQLSPGVGIEGQSHYNADGTLQEGEAYLGFPIGSFLETWATGSHQFSATETAQPGTTSPLVQVTDEAFDNAGHMTGAQVWTFGIQGQPFTETNEIYDANWHLTSWTGANPATGYDQTVNYTVGSTSA